MPPIKCTLFAEIKYRSNNIRLLYKIADPQTSHELYVSFDDLAAVMNKGKYAENRKNIITDYKNKSKQACIVNDNIVVKSDASVSENLSVISHGILFKLMVEAKASDSFCDWITKAINNEVELLSTNKLNREIDELKSELNKWKSGKQDTVYILNFYPYDDGIYKIGLTDKIERRVADLNTGTPSEIIVEYKRDCGNKRVTEQIMHYVLEKYRVNPNKEFFRIPRHIAIGVLDNVVDCIDGMHNLLSSHAAFDRTNDEFTKIMNEFTAISADRTGIIINERHNAPPPVDISHQTDKIVHKARKWSMW